MNTINKILILEDEKLNSERIKRLILKIRPDVEIVGVLARDIDVVHVEADGCVHGRE